MKFSASITFSFLMLLFSFGIACGQSAVIDASTLNNKIMAGYQGWFMCEGDGADRGWRHWNSPSNETPDADNISFDMWPDMREYDADELYSTAFVYSDNSNAGLYSAYNFKTVDRHVQWMKDYGIDGVFVQRFVGEAVNITPVRDKVLQNVRNSAETNGRVFANMYDISGSSATNFVEDVKNDWMHLVDDLQITQSDRYLHHNGLPVLAIWGFGVSGREQITTAMAAELVQWFTVDAPPQYLVTLMGGVDDDWRTQTEWRPVFDNFDIISPWTVGRYVDNAGADNFRTNKIEPDIIETQNLNIDYLPVVFPGFSWWNLKGEKFNHIKRNGGDFLWNQLYNVIDAGCNMVYVAMFDEVDEGTAIYKVTENAGQTPTTGLFLTLDAEGEYIPSDWYLRLTAEGSKMLRNEIPLTSTIPIDPVEPGINLAVSDIPVSGTVTESYRSTFSSDNYYESIEEEESGGKPSKRRSFLEHKWTIDVTGSSSVIFKLEAHKTVNSEGDNFVFAYSTDDVNYIDMVTVTKTSDDDTYQIYTMPGSLSGTVYIRVKDTDRSQGNRSLDEIFIDQMYIDSRGGEPVQYSLTTNTSGNGSVSLNPPGGIYDGGTIVTLTAIPEAGWIFSGWSGNLSGSANPETITMNSDKTVTASFAEPGTADYVADSDIPVSGTVSGDYSITRSSDNSHESIQERESGGKPAKRHSYLEHKWTINVAGGSLVTFNLEAHKTVSSDGDDFVFAYSTDDVNYTNMVTVTKTSDDDTYQTYEMPGSLSGTVYIRVMDTDQSQGNRSLDEIFIDHMFIHSDAGLFRTKENISSVVVPHDFELLQNYPNPFNPTTTIQYSLKDASIVTLAVYNMQGRLIKTLFKGSQHAGSYEIKWSAEDLGNNLASGIYIYKLHAASNAREFTRTRKMVLMK